MASLTTVSMAESSGGGPGSSTPGQLANIQQVACIFCTVPLPYPSAPFCTHCGCPQKKCINSQCQAPVPPSAPMCYYCRTPQQQSAKKCINPQCGAPLHPIAMFCATCSAPQDPAMFQQFLSAAHCISCSAKLLIPGQKSCHNCGTLQSTQTSMEHSGHQPVPNVSQPSAHLHVSQSSHPHRLTRVPANAPVSQPSTPYPQTSQLSSLTPQATAHPHSSRPSHHHIPQAASRPHTHQPPSPLSYVPPLPHVPLATPNPNTFQPPPPPPPTTTTTHPASPPHIPQATPHPHSQTGLTVQQQVFSATNSPYSETFNSTRKRSRIEVKLAKINICALVRML